VFDADDVHAQSVRAAAVPGAGWWWRGVVGLVDAVAVVIVVDVVVLAVVSSS
jgi:hypothetical protein